jgi:hypothetical protein
MLPRISAFSLLLFCLLNGGSFAGYKDDIGYTQLQSELGSAAPTGAGIIVSHVEADENGSTSGDLYVPNTSLAEFSGKSFTFQSTDPQISNHATEVGKRFYGSSTSIAPGISTIYNYDAGKWLGSDYLNTGANGLGSTGVGGALPKTDGARVQNHSWISGDSTNDAEILRRFDYVIRRDNVTAVVGLNNESNTVVPNVLAANYNAITVGITSGNHSRGGTRIETAGRMKPDLVVPENVTSYATPIVSSAAALLWETANQNAALSGARQNLVIKGVLMAGATKTEFTNWSRTATSPLDPVYGAGELNIYNSHRILTAGKAAAGSGAINQTKAWDFNTAASSSSLLYYFDVSSGSTLDQFSIALTWNRIVTPNGNNFTNAQVSLANLDLRLYAVNGLALGNEIDRSISTVDNVEHIYQQQLAAGRYAIQVFNHSASTEFGLAWGGTLNVIPEPSSAILLLTGAGFCICRRYRGNSSRQ